MIRKLKHLIVPLLLFLFACEGNSDIVNTESLKDELLIGDLLDENIVFIRDNNYYLWNKEGFETQLTSTDEEINDDLIFMLNGSGFVYTSKNNNKYYLNHINLETYESKILFSSTIEIEQLRVSPSDNHVYFLQNNIVSNINLENSGYTKILNLRESYFNKYVLFHDCQRVIYFYSEIIHNNVTGIIEIYNYLTNEIVLNDTVFNPYYFIDINESDSYLCVIIDDNGKMLISLESNDYKQMSGWLGFCANGSKAISVDDISTTRGFGTVQIIEDIYSGRIDTLYDGNPLTDYKPTYSDKSSKYIFTENIDGRLNLKIYDDKLKQYNSLFQSGYNYRSARFIP